MLYFFQNLFFKPISTSELIGRTILEMRRLSVGGKRLVDVSSV